MLAQLPDRYAFISVKCNSKQREETMPRLSLTHNGLAVDDSNAFTEDQVQSQPYPLGGSLPGSWGSYQLTSQALSIAAAAGIDTEGLKPIPVSSPDAGTLSNGPVLSAITTDQVQSRSRPKAHPLFDQLYAVGDSMSDSGGIYQLSKQALTAVANAGIPTDGLQPIPISPPYDGKFSNGPVLPEITAQLLGAQLINFSFGGAEALGTLTFEQAAGPAIPDALKAAIAALPPDKQAPINAVLDKNINLSGQMADLVAETSAHLPSAHSALVSLIGLNDLQALEGTFDPSNPLALIGEAAQVVAGIVHADLGVAHTAFNQGIGTVIFETLPAPSFFPAGKELPPELQAIGDSAVDAINLGLKVDAAVLRLEGHDARIVDLAKITDEISADPSAFGFQNLAQPTLLGNGIEFSVNPAAPPPDQTAFFDPLHPTTKLHAVLAQFVAASLTSHSDFWGGGNNVVAGGHDPLADTVLGQLVASR
jgi:phospholipase/lecithinase/hemolysin